MKIKSISLRRYILHSIHVFMTGNVLPSFLVRFAYKLDSLEKTQLTVSDHINHELYSEPSFPAPQLYLLRHTLSMHYNQLVISGDSTTGRLDFTAQVKSTHAVSSVESGLAKFQTWHFDNGVTDVGIWC